MSCDCKENGHSWATQPNTPDRNKHRFGSLHARKKKSKVNSGKYKLHKSRKEENKNK